MLSIGDDMSIESNKLKVDETDEAQGVFFRLANGTEHKVTLRLSVNLPGQIIVREPKAIQAEKVEVIVRTKFSGAKQLKKIREITYGYPCMSKT